MDFEKESITPKDDKAASEDDLKEQIRLEAEDVGDADFNQEVEEELIFDESSTIFNKKADNKNHTVKKVSAKKRKRRTLISLLALAVVMCAGIFLAIEFLPEDSETTSEDFTLKVKMTAAEDVEEISVTNEHGQFSIVPFIDESESNLDIDWELKGTDMSLISDTTLGTVADSCLSIYATREMENKTLDYGFDNPQIVINVKMADSAQDYTLKVGDISPDKTGYYIQLSDNEKIYLITASTFDNLDFTPEDLAIVKIINSPKLDDDTPKENKNYFDDEGNISTFDYIKISGTNYDETITINPIADNQMAYYTVTTPKGTRYGDTDTCNDMFGILSNGIVAMEAYKLSPSAEDIKHYRLDAPEHDITIKYGTETIHLIASMYDTENNYYAVMVDGINTIYEVSGDALAMLSAKKEDYYNEFVFLEYYYSFSEVTINTPTSSYKFITGYDEDDSFVVELNGKSIEKDLFCSYYEHIVSIAPKGEDSYTSGKADYTATFGFSDTDKGTKKLELIKQTDRRYLVVVDGMEMGIVSSSIYDNLVEYVENVVNGKGVPEP